MIIQHECGLWKATKGTEIYWHETRLGCVIWLQEV
jgi:hypothetical protein